MNTTFNTNRFGLLLKRYFTENKQRELTFWGITIVVFMLMRDTSSVVTYLIIAGYFTAANSFRIFGHTPGAMHYLLIPATHTEKLVANILLNTLYFFAAFLITYLIGTFLGIQLDNLIFGHNKPLTFKLFTDIADFNGNGKYLWYVFYSFSLVQAIAITGSLYFKRSAAMKTILTIFILFFIFGLIEMLMLKITFGTYSLSRQSLNINMGPHELSEIFSASEYIFKIIGLVLLPFLWIVSYFRLTEKQV